MKAVCILNTACLDIRMLIQAEWIMANWPVCKHSMLELCLHNLKQRQVEHAGRDREPQQGVWSRIHLRG
jgi:hypothetical protein